MNQYSNWSRADLKSLVRRELMDTNTRWWSDDELNLYAQWWLDETQRDNEFIWGTSTIITATNTITLGTFTPPMIRLESVYWLGTYTSGFKTGGYRLAGRHLYDLEVMNREWREVLPDTPREVIQYDSQTVIIWPPQTGVNGFVFEYPQSLSLTNDTQLIPLPAWTQFTAKYYICSKAFLKPGPTNDLQKALRYRKKFNEAKVDMLEIWNGFQPYRYLKLKPAGHYEADILRPPVAFNDPSTTKHIMDQYQSYVPTPAPDGTNLVFTVPTSLVGTYVKVYLNGLLQEVSKDFTLSGSNITFIYVPQSTDTIVVWVFTPNVLV